MALGRTARQCVIRAPIFPAIESQVLQAVRVRLTGPEIGEKAPKAGVEGMAPAVDDPGAGQDRRDEAEVQKVGRHLVDDPRRIGRVGAQQGDSARRQAETVRGRPGRTSGPSWRAYRALPPSANTKER